LALPNDPLKQAERDNQYRANDGVSSMKLRSLAHLYLFSHTRARETLEADIDRWAELHQLPIEVRSSYERSLRYLMFHWPEFRSLFYFRTADDLGGAIGLFRRLSIAFYPPLPLLLIAADQIGPGFFIQHGFSTIIMARQIGRNFWVNQQVTIGYSGINKYPTIGDDVRVSAGAKVLGDIHIGDDVMIGANAVVVRDVPAHCTVAGVPARIIRRNGQRVQEKLI
jgi:serine O-acetyltransferase